MIKRYRTILALCVLPLAAFGCTEDYNFTEPVYTFDVTPKFTSIDEGTTVQLEALSGSGEQMSGVTWLSDNEAIVRVNSSGLVTAVAPGGPANVIARVGEEARSASITVIELQGIALTKGVPRTGLGGTTGSQQLYRIFVPAGTTKLTVTLSGGSGDADIYVRRQIPPTTSAATAWSFNIGNTELVEVNNPQQGTWYILVDVWETFAGATLTATYTP